MMSPQLMKQHIQAAEELWHVVEPFLLRLLMVAVFIEEVCRVGWHMLIAG